MMEMIEGGRWFAGNDKDNIWKGSHCVEGRKSIKGSLVCDEDLPLNETIGLVLLGTRIVALTGIITKFEGVDYDWVSDGAFSDMECNPFTSFGRACGEKCFIFRENKEDGLMPLGETEEGRTESRFRKKLSRIAWLSRTMESAVKDLEQL